MLTHAHLREILHYSVINGQFYHIKKRQKIRLGQTAGNLHPNGYRYIRINGESYLAHRLAWFWVTGEWPANEIDHKNGIRDANWWLNLREATHSQNMHNTGMRSNNTSGYKGVTWYSKYQKWQAQIMINKKNNNLGYFENINVAYAARIKAEKELFGDFSRQ